MICILITFPGIRNHISYTFTSIDIAYMGLKSFYLITWEKSDHESWQIRHKKKRNWWSLHHDHWHDICQIRKTKTIVQLSFGNRTNAMMDTIFQNQAISLGDQEEAHHHHFSRILCAILRIFCRKGHTITARSDGLSVTVKSITIF